MTLSEQKALLRLLLDDADSVRWTNAQLVTALNAAARKVSKDVELNSAFPSAPAGSATLSVVSGTLSYAMPATAVTVRSVRRTDVSPYSPLDEIEYRERDDYLRSGRVFNSLGRYVFYQEFDSSGLLTINFPNDPATTMTLTADYQKVCPTLVESSDDGNSFALPVFTHDMVVYLAAGKLSRSDAQREQFVQDYLDERGTVLGTLKRRTSPRFIGNRSGLI